MGNRACLPPRTLSPARAGAGRAWAHGGRGSGLTLPDPFHFMSASSHKPVCSLRVPGHLLSGPRSFALMLREVRRPADLPGSQHFCFLLALRRCGGCAGVPLPQFLPWGWSKKGQSRSC